MFILLAGMTFQSGVTTPGSGPHTALTVLVALVLVGSVLLFLAMLAREVWNSIRFARRQQQARAAAIKRRQSAMPEAATVKRTAASGGSHGAAPTRVGGGGGSVDPNLSTGPSLSNVSTTPSSRATGSTGTWTTNPLKGGSTSLSATAAAGTRTASSASGSHIASLWGAGSRSSGSLADPELDPHTAVSHGASHGVGASVASESARTAPPMLSPPPPPPPPSSSSTATSRILSSLLLAHGASVQVGAGDSAGHPSPAGPSRTGRVAHMTRTVAPQ
jgi:hypothetical protein